MKDLDNMMKKATNNYGWQLLLTFLEANTRSNKQYGITEGRGEETQEKNKEKKENIQEKEETIITTIKKGNTCFFSF